MIFVFIMMCQLMFEALLSTRSREFIVGSKLITVLIHSRPMLFVTKASVTMPCEAHLLGTLKIPMAVYRKGIDFMLSWVSCGRNKMALE